MSNFSGMTLSMPNCIPPMFICQVFYPVQSDKTVMSLVLPTFLLLLLFYLIQPVSLLRQRQAQKEVYRCPDNRSAGLFVKTHFASVDLVPGSAGQGCIRLVKFCFHCCPSNNAYLSRSSSILPSVQYSGFNSIPM